MQSTMMNTVDYNAEQTFNKGLHNDENNNDYYLAESIWAFTVMSEPSL